MLTAQSAPGTDVLVAGQDVPPPVRIKSRLPDYPEWLRQATPRVQGVVMLAVTVDEEGRPETVKVLRGIPMFDPPAVDAVKKWRYAPTIADGVRRRVKFIEYVDFYLSDRDRVQDLGRLLRATDGRPDVRLWAMGRLLQVPRNHHKEVMEALAAAAKDPDPAVATAARPPWRNSRPQADRTGHSWRFSGRWRRLPW